MRKYSRAPLARGSVASWRRMYVGMVRAREKPFASEDMLSRQAHLCPEVYVKIRVKERIVVISKPLARH